MDVARLAGVSRSVVSAVINGTQGIGVSRTKREAVLKAMRELNYHVDASARAMKTGRSYCVAVFGDTSNALFLQLLEGLQQASLRHGYHVLLVGQGSGSTSRDELISLYFQRRVDGIITLDPLGYADEAWASSIREHQIPFVSVEGYAGVEDIYSVMADYYGSVRAAMEFMESRGKAGVTYLQMEDGHCPENWAERARREAYADFCAERGWTYRVERVQRQEPAQIQAVLEYDRAAGVPTVYLSNWTDAALEIYRAAARLDLKIGHDIAVMSSDNTYRVSSRLVPPLTVMAVPYQEMGEKAVELLLEQIESRDGGKVECKDEDMQEGMHEDKDDDKNDGENVGGYGAEDGDKYGNKCGKDEYKEASAGRLRKHWLPARLLPGKSV
ncbi:LacI family transcriptional regulator [Paenibacillus physcomitrellae]|uniref:LacI family transcriptional regulator n=2 Tax=Paenibacillus physcomitrellae TaxID=1619311 RepID=A0ABQ1FVE3_9BACL|nr:LacI family transcriptional regulator [Paenibacillus physcomitrellae]